jgi:dTDP-4-dehydrorhamnose reductase
LKALPGECQMPSEPASQQAQPELWAGVECTVNRVGDVYFDQLELSDHASRIEDLDLLAALGVRAVRYPVLWERTAPEGLARANWAWPDARLRRLRELNLRPVVGLVHHGSGPRTTSLVDEGFAVGLAQYARAVAARYPWVEDYTPVNEPLTTARFSGLYGHWYPHRHDALTFARALLTQVRAVVLSMRAVREVNPRARLVQTEDLGKTFSTPTLIYQAEFENERRWLTFDLLSGRVGRGHAMWDYLRWVGVSCEELEWFAENSCPPDVVGVNHYLTSERFLDERVARYPAHTHGGNGRHTYADVEAVRVCAEGPAGPRALLREVWERYRLPIVVTEVHLGCTREEQLRWLRDVWEAACESRAQGRDVRAVTAWSAFGAFDWHNLLTRREGRYEPGVYDLRAPWPRPTALASMLRDLAARGEHDHPVLDSHGWWHRLDRLCYPPVTRVSNAVAVPTSSVRKCGESARPLLITGATGTLGRAFARACEQRGLSYRLTNRSELDIAETGRVEGVLDALSPWAVVNAAGYVRVDCAESEPDLCLRENAHGAAVLATACASRGIALLTFSSDLVFDGTKLGPYLETDSPAPLNVYGRSKAEAERLVAEAHEGALVVRTSAFFGPWDEHNFVTHALDALSAGRAFPAASDVTVSPTYVPDLVHACLDLLIDGERGLWHLANEGEVTWAGLARAAAAQVGLDASLVEPRPNESFRLPARRPTSAVLTSERSTLLPPLGCALSRYAAEYRMRRPLNTRSAVRGLR